MVLKSIFYLILMYFNIVNSIYNNSHKLVNSYYLIIFKLALDYLWTSFILSLVLLLAIRFSAGTVD
jgi:hypothetical protein